jgi:alpha-glucosidase
VAGRASFSEVKEEYPFLGAKAVAVNHARTVSIPVTERGGTRFVIEARAYDDGFAWRLVWTPQRDAAVRILGETSTFSLPGGEVWFGERNNDWKLKSYAVEFHHVGVDELPKASSQGPVQAAPLVVEMPRGFGYALYTEAALENFSGMRLRAAGERTLQVDFTEGDAGFMVAGPVVTPWRVVMLCPDLNCLVNNTLTENLNPAPDEQLFHDTSYIRAGRSVWRFLSRQTGTPDQEREFVDYAVALGYEYTLVDDGWKRWATPWPSLKELADYGRVKHVGVFAWKDANEMMDPAEDYEALRSFLNHARDAGLAGVKIDFINGESKTKVDFERKALRLAAERRLMIDFHGIQKPTGEERSFPNGLSREGIRGIELNQMAEGPIPASHNAALPYTRMAVGPGDYTPLSLMWPGETTWSHQLATAVLLSAPILCIAEDPQLLLKNPDTAAVLPLVKALPAVWDETVVLPGSKIGGVTAIARRKGSVWFVAYINGGTERALLPQLGMRLEGYRATVVTSLAKRAFSVAAYADATRWGQGEWMAPGDGVVVLLEPVGR